MPNRPIPRTTTPDAIEALVDDLWSDGFPLAQFDGPDVICRQCGLRIGSHHIVLAKPYTFDELMAATSAKEIVGTVESPGDSPYACATAGFVLG